MDNKEPTKEQLKEFWEWCGLIPHELKDINGNKSYDWYDSKCLIVAVDIPCLNLDLNNLFKYAVYAFVCHYGITKMREILNKWINEAYMALPKAEDLFTLMQEVIHG